MSTPDLPRTESQAGGLDSVEVASAPMSACVQSRSPRSHARQAGPVDTPRAIELSRGCGGPPNREPEARSLTAADDPVLCAEMVMLASVVDFCFGEQRTMPIAKAAGPPQPASPHLERDSHVAGHRSEKQRAYRKGRFALPPCPVRARRRNLAVMPPILRPELPDVVQRQGLLDVVEGAEELVQRGFCWIVPRIRTRSPSAPS